MMSLKKVQLTPAMTPAAGHYGAFNATLIAERMALVELLQQHLITTLDLRQYVSSIESRLRNVSFIDLRQLFHRIGEATRDCADFLSERIYDLGASAERSSVSVLYEADPDTWRHLNFAACLTHINSRAQTLIEFSSQARPLMDSAVRNGDYASLHLITDCTYKISQLVALIQIHLPAEAVAAPSTTPSFGVHGAA